ncbi:helix-turn-helix domain-containing protein [Nocardia sp. NPDC005745]|uniref:helix-turn-helix domain-containing protein n=1 Tax=Nocardia sp. NPDC005745 TaxID=3157061 RepID=UPI0033FA4089
MMASAEFGPELRRRRVEQKMTLGKLAERVHYSTSHLSRIENGHKSPSAALARICDTVLSAGGDLLMLAPPEPQPDGDPEIDDDIYSEAEWLLRLQVDGSGAFHLGESHAPPVTAFPPVLTGSAIVLPGLSAMFEQTRQLGRTSSPSIVLPMVVTQTHAAVTAARQSTGELRQRLLLHAARTAEFAGWMAQECGDERGALWWTDQAVLHASAVSDAHMTSYALVRRAVLSLYRGDSSATTGLTEQVLADHAVHPRIRWLAALGAAQGYAIGLNDSGSMRALDKAASLYDAAHRTGDNALGPSALHERPVLIEAWCHYDLGNLREAAVLFDRALSQNFEQSDRDRARFGTRRALVYAALGELDRACALIEPLLDIISAVDSMTIRADLREFARTIGRYRGHSALHDIQPALMSALSRR